MLVLNVPDRLEIIINPSSVLPTASAPTLLSSLIYTLNLCSSWKACVRVDQDWGTGQKFVDKKTQVLNFRLFPSEVRKRTDLKVAGKVK